MAETGLSDFHGMTLTVTKNELSEAQTKSCELPDYKRFANVRYRITTNVLLMYDIEMSYYVKFLIVTLNSLIANIVFFFFYLC